MDVKVFKSPTKWDLFNSVAEGKIITIGTNVGDLRVKILAIEQEDGSYESWNIKGVVINSGYRSFNGYIRTDRNSGSLKL